MTDEDDLSEHYLTGVRRVWWRFWAWRFRRRQKRAASSLPVIEPRLLAQLLEVVPSRNGAVEFRPCRVQLAESGEWCDRVYVVEALSYAQYSGLAIDDTHYLALASVSRIESSPTRLPPALADKLYAAGESGMGYCVFTLVTRDGGRIPCVTDNAVDWIQLPDDVAPHDLVEVLPHEGLERFRNEGEASYAHGAQYAWCLCRLPG